MDRLFPGLLSSPCGKHRGNKAEAPDARDAHGHPGVVHESIIINSATVVSVFGTDKRLGKNAFSQVRCCEADSLRHSTVRLEVLCLPPIHTPLLWAPNPSEAQYREL